MYVRKYCLLQITCINSFDFSPLLEHFFHSSSKQFWKLNTSFFFHLCFISQQFDNFLNLKFSVKNYRWKWHRGTSSDAKLQSPTPLPLRSSHPLQNHGGLFRPLHQRISPGLNVSFSVSQKSTESMLYVTWIWKSFVFKFSVISPGLGRRI